MTFRSLFGPSTLITAAFIGPGTLTTCTLAGIHHKYDLLWALAFAAVATIILQEMAARLGWVTGAGLGESLQEQFQGPLSRFLVFGLVLSAIFVGNAAYEAGNLSGAVVGLRLLTNQDRLLWPLLVGGLGFGLLSFGKYKLIERFLISLVILMSCCFLLTALLVRPDLRLVANGLLPRRISSENFFLVMGIIGTTVVPYNLFLHASTISKKWGPKSSLWEIRIETAVAVLLGVMISMLIVITSAATAHQLPGEGALEINNAEQFAVQLEPLAGKFAKYLMGIGFLAAGLSSALTAPLAAAYAAQGLFGWRDGEKNSKFITCWVAILLVGVTVSMTHSNLLYVIRFAQVANAIALPFMGGVLLWLVNSRKVMATHCNGLAANVLAGFILVLLIALSAAGLAKAYYSLFS